MTAKPAPVPRPPASEERPGGAGWRERWHEIIFEADTPAGKRFDLALLALILLSVFAVCLESVREIREAHGPLLHAVEWAFTGLFTLEYAARLATVRRPLRYAVSFYGLVDLLAILPTYVSAFFPGSQSLLVIRALRLLRVFRILKLTHFVGEANLLGAAMRASTRKIIVFLGVVVTTVLIAGTRRRDAGREQHAGVSRMRRRRPRQRRAALQVLREQALSGGGAGVS